MSQRRSDRTRDGGDQCRRCGRGRRVIRPHRHFFVRAVRPDLGRCSARDVRRLVLYGGWLRGDNLGPRGVREHILGLVEQHWGLGSDVLTDIFAPDADAGFRPAFALYQRRSCDAATARRLLALGYDLDVTADAAKVVAPTTVLHREDDRAVPVAEGRQVAAAIESAAFVQLPGRTHIPFAGDSNTLIDAMRSGMGDCHDRSHTSVRHSLVGSLRLLPLSPKACPTARSPNVW